MWYLRRSGDRINMKYTAIVLVLCACVWISAADVAHLKATKAKLIGRLTGKHHKRGVLSSVPPFKLGYDIPLVTHSVVKPVVVTYPPTASVTAVKVPLSHPLLPRHPVPVGHKVPVPHPHYGLKFPHHKSVYVSKPDHHFHHHHHHLAPRPVVPVHAAPVPAPVVPLPAPTVNIAHPIPAPPPAAVVPSAPVLPPPVIPQPTPLSPHLHVIPQNHPFHLKPVLQAPPVIPAAPTQFLSPVFPAAPQIPYVLRPGGSVQTSLFATYPRYPFLNYQSPLIPLTSSAVSQIVPHIPQYVPQGHAPDGVVVEHPGVHAHGEIPQPEIHGHPGISHGQPDIHLQGQPEFHFQQEQPQFLQPIHPGVHYSGQPDLQLQPGVHVHAGQPQPQPDVHLHGHQPDIHLQPAQPDIHLQPSHPDTHFHAGQPDFHFQPTQPDVNLHGGQPDVHFHTGQPDLHFHNGQPDVHFHNGQPDVHYQTGQPDVHLHAGQPDIHFHQGQPDQHLQPNPAVDNNGWSPVPSQPNDVHPEQHYPNDGHHQFTQEQGNQVYEQHGPSNEEQYHEYQHQLQHHIQQQLEQAQYEQNLHNHQLSPEYGAPGAASQHYGVPQGAEGRSADSNGEDDTPQFHNHIPLGLQPPIDRPLDHFH